MKLYKALDQCQTDTKTAIFAGLAAADLHKWLEHLGE
jgi:hypothetical protein